MRKFIKITLLTAFCILAFDGCQSKSQSQSQDTVIEKKIPEEVKIVETAAPSEAVILNDNNENTFTSTIAIESDRATQSYTIDQQIELELTAGVSTFQEPFIMLNPFGNSPLTAVVLFKTEEECAVRVTVQGNTDQTDVVGNVDAATSHRVPVIGLYAARDNEVTIELLDKDNQVINQTTIRIQTDPLPIEMENLVKVEKYTKPSAYGLIEVSGFDTKNPFAFDTEGNVRWYLSEKFASYGYFPLSNDHFVVMDAGVMIQTYEKPHAQQLYEMDYLGRVYEVYLLGNGVHHEVIEKTPGGNLLILTNSIDGHVEDVVQEIDRESGEVVKSLDMREIFGETYVDKIDWVHLNTVSYNEANDTILLSPRNLHCGIKVNWSTNELIWILGNPKFWENTAFEDKVLQPEGDIIWTYQPHSIYEIEEDLDGDANTMHVMLFDNHWEKMRKVDFYDDLDSSYVSLFTINEAKMTVSQPHTYTGIKSKITSNFTFDYKAARVFFMGGVLAKETEAGSNGMIYEYDYETEEVINQYSLQNTFYRAYEFEPDFNACIAPLKIENIHFKGNLKVASLNEAASPAPAEILQEGISLSIIQQILYIQAGDHKVSKIEFIGKVKSYMLDISFTKGEEKYLNFVYKMVVPFSNLEPDEYKVVLTYGGTRYSTGETITIQ